MARPNNLVSGDPDLLVISQFGETGIVTMVEFQQILAAL
jgi:predicted nucleic acid-binding protein